MAKVGGAGVAWGAGDAGVAEAPGWPEAPGTAGWWCCRVPGDRGVGGVWGGGAGHERAKQVRGRPRATRPRTRPGSTGRGAGPGSRVRAGPPPPPSPQTARRSGACPRPPGFYIAAGAPRPPRCERGCSALRIGLFLLRSRILAPLAVDPSPRPPAGPASGLRDECHATGAPRALDCGSDRAGVAPRAASGTGRRGRCGHRPRGALRAVRRACPGPVRAASSCAPVRRACARAGLRLLPDVRAARGSALRRLHRALRLRPPLPAAARRAAPATSAAGRPRALRQRQRRRPPARLPAARNARAR